MWEMKESHNKEEFVTIKMGRAFSGQTKTFATMVLCQISTGYPGNSSSLAQLRHPDFTRLGWRWMGGHFNHLLSHIY